MPDREEVLSALYGAYRLARFDASGMTYFCLTVEGFWRSFFAAALVAPAYAILVGMHASAGAEDLNVALLFLAEGLSYVLAWCAFPIAALVLTRLLGLDRNYVALIVAHNWSAVLQAAAFLAVLLLGLVLPDVPGRWLATLTTGALLVYQWFVIRSALQTSGGVALMLLLVDLVITSMISAGTDRVL
jgi:hypothetical protein